MKKLLLHEVKHEQYVVLEYNEYDELIETTLPENVTVFSEIDDNDLREGMQNTYALAL